MNYIDYKINPPKVGDLLCVDFKEDIIMVWAKGKKLNLLILDNDCKDNPVWTKEQQLLIYIIDDNIKMPLSVNWFYDKDLTNKIHCREHINSIQVINP